MQALTLAMLVIVTTFEFLAHGDKWGRWAFLPGSAAYFAELVGAAAAIYVVFAGTRSNFRFVRPAYWFVFGALLVTVVFGVLVNGVDAGPIFAGTRSYLRAIPWFLVPAVYAYSDRQVQTQLKALLAIALIQIPLAVQQRIATGNSRGIQAATGDWTSGTLEASGALSIFLVICICIAAAFAVRKRLPAWQFALLFALLLFPTLINETKVTIFLLPIGLLVAFLAASAPGRRVRAVLVVSCLFALFLTIFFPVYDYMNSGRRYAVPLTEMLGDPARLERYLWKKESAGTTEEVGRVDSFVVPLAGLSSDPANLIFGYGIGNASDSSIGHAFVGQKFRMFGRFLNTVFARIVLELGLLGVGLVLTLMWLIFQDARTVARRDNDYFGALAAGWTAVTAVMVMSIFYREMIADASLSFLFWYFSGLIAAKRMRIADSPQRLTGAAGIANSGHPCGLGRQS